MIEKNRVKERIAQGEPSFGVGLLWPSPELAELMGALGFDWLWLDIEHGPFDLNALYHTVRAADSVGLQTILRLPKTQNPEDILPYLEVGATGMILAHTQSGEDVRQAVRAATYPPTGERSAGAMRGAGWGTVQDFYKKYNDQFLMMALVEDEVGLENLDDILAVDELDAVVIGFGDLSLTMGHPRGHPEVLKVGTPAQQKVLESRKALQVTAQDGREARMWIERGALMVRCTMHTVLSKAAATWLDEAKGR